MKPLVETKEMAALATPEAFYGLLGISQSRDRSFWLQVSTLTPGPAYRGDTLYERFKYHWGRGRSLIRRS